jgi:hypothetical protein
VACFIAFKGGLVEVSDEPVGGFDAGPNGAAGSRSIKMSTSDAASAPPRASVDLGYRAIGERLDAHAQELQPLIEGGDIGLAARQTVQALCDDDVEPARLSVRYQTQQARPVEGRGAGDGGVVVHVHHVQAAGFGIAPSEVDLVGDGAKVLQSARSSLANILSSA